MARHVAAVWMAGVVACASSTAAAEDLKTVKEKIMAGWDKHRSITAKVKLVAEATGSRAHKSKGEGTYQVLKQGEKTLFRTDHEIVMVVKAGGREMKMVQKATKIMDGQYTYSLVEAMRGTAATKAKATPRDRTDPNSMFKQLDKAYTLKLLPEERVDGQQVYVIEATAKKKRKGSFTKGIYYFRKDGILVKQTAQMDESKMTTTFTDIKLNGKIDPGRFVFKPPPGVEVRDMTGQ